MSLKVSYASENLVVRHSYLHQAEIEIWVKALEAFEKKEYREALHQFSKIADSSRIMFNVGVVHATMGDHKAAIAAYRQAQALDPYFAVSYFQSVIVAWFYVHSKLTNSGVSGAEYRTLPFGSISKQLNAFKMHTIICERTKLSSQYFGLVAGIQVPSI